MRESKRIVSLLLVMLWLLVGMNGIGGESIVYATEAADWETPVGTLWSSGRTNPEHGTLLDESNLNKVYTVRDQVGGWFKMVAPRSGDYAFYVVAPELKYGKFHISVSVDSEVVAWLPFEQSIDVQKGVVRGIEAGQVITWWNENGSGKGVTLQNPFKMMLAIEGEVPQEDPSAVSKEEIRRQIGIFNFNELTNVTHVDVSKDGAYQSFDVWFEDGVYYGGSDGYEEKWLTSEGIVAEIEIDMDADLRDEYVVLYVKPIWISGNRYEEFRIMICEAENGKYVKAADFECGFSMYGFGRKRYMELLPCDDGVKIVANGSDIFSYDGQNAYIELISGLTTQVFCDDYDYIYGYSYALKGKFDTSRYKELKSACSDGWYDPARLGRLVSLNENNFFSTKSGNVEKGVRMMEACGVSTEIVNEYVRVKGGMLFAESVEESGRQDRNRMRFYTSLNHEAAKGSQNGNPDSNAENIDTGATGVVYIHDSSNLRSGPGLSYKTVSSVTGGKTMTWLGEVSVDERGVIWYKVLRKNAEAAWISSRYSELRTADGSQPQLPFGKLMKGNKGERVLELQNMLKELGYHTGSCDGDYGSGTEKSVKAFQNAMGLSVTGEVDEETWQAIEAALQPQELEEEMSMEEIFAELSVEEEYPMTSYISGLNRSALIRWLNNKDEWYGHNSGYMLLEQTLDANSNGAWAAVADRMFSYGFDLLNGLLDTLSGNMVGVTSSALDMSVRFGLEFYDPQVIERMLIETYADYMEGMQQEAQAAQEQYNANLTLYEMYKKLKDLYDAGDLVIKGTENTDIAMRQILSKELALSDLAYLTLDRQEAWSYAIRKCMTDGNVQPGEVEAFDAMWKKYNRYHDVAVRMQQAGVEDKLSMCGYGLDAVSMVNSLLIFCEKYGYEAERYAGMIGFMACTSAEYFSMLDHWADTAERMGADKYAEAIRLFRQDFEEVAQRRIENLIMDNAGQESINEVVDVVNGAAAIVGDMIEVYRKSKNIDTTQKFSWSIISRTAENIIRNSMSWDQKAETMEKMVFCRSLKETLAESLIRQLYEFDAMQEGEAKEEKAAVIAAGLKYMKTLKYYGEGVALDLCSLLSEGGNYIHAEYQLVAKINGTWAVIEGVIQPPEGEGRYTDTALDLIQMEGLQYGYLKNSSITSTNAGDNELAVTIANRSVWVEFVYALSDASVMTTEEMLEDRQMLESINNRRREQVANDPDYIEYWQDYIENFSIPAIEWLE